jgi:hypothetical protein
LSREKFEEAANMTGARALARMIPAGEMRLDVTSATDDEVARTHRVARHLNNLSLVAALTGELERRGVKPLPPFSSVEMFALLKALKQKEVRGPPTPEEVSEIAGYLEHPLPEWMGPLVAAVTHAEQKFPGQELPMGCLFAQTTPRWPGCTSEARERANTPDHTWWDVLIEEVMELNDELEMISGTYDDRNGEKATLRAAAECLQVATVALRMRRALLTGR